MPNKIKTGARGNYARLRHTKKLKKVGIGEVFENIIRAIGFNLCEKKKNSIIGRVVLKRKVHLRRQLSERQSKLQLYQKGNLL